MRSVLRKFLRLKKWKANLYRVNRRLRKGRSAFSRSADEHCVRTSGNKFPVPQGAVTRVVFLLEHLCGCA